MKVNNFYPNFLLKNGCAFWEGDNVTVLILIFSLLIGEKAKGQCPTDTILHFVIQDEIDAFLIDYPDCKDYHGDVLVYNASNSFAINNLQGLQKIKSIGGWLRIIDNNALLNFSGLENLRSIGGRFFIIDNDAIINMSGLSNLTSIGRSTHISDNNNLIDFTGLENLTSINGILNIGNNYDLTSISQLVNLTYIGKELGIEQNNDLSLCNTSFICDYIINEYGDTEIYENDPGCDSSYDIELQCESIGNISLHYFYDENQNGVQDIGETYLSNMSADIAPGVYTLFGNQNKAATKYLPFGDYTISINQEEYWNLTSTNDAYSITVDSLQIIDTFYFGFIPDTLIPSLSTNCVNSSVPFPKSATIL